MGAALAPSDRSPRGFLAPSSARDCVRIAPTHKGSGKSFAVVGGADHDRGPRGARLRNSTANLATSLASRQMGIDRSSVVCLMLEVVGNVRFSAKRSLPLGAGREAV